MRRINVLWAIDHVCYDGSLHGGGRLYWNVLPRFDLERYRVVPCLLRATDVIRDIFTQSPVPVRILDKAKFDPTTIMTFLRLIKNEQIDVMHLHCYAASTFGRLAGRLTGVPTVIHDYDTEVYFPYPSYLGLADRVLAPATKGAIAASPMVQRFLMHKRKMSPERIRLMLHAIPMQTFDAVPQYRIDQARGHLGLGTSAPVVGAITKLGPQRGNELFLRAACEARQHVPEARFVLLYKPTEFHRLPNRNYVPVSDAEQHEHIQRLRDLSQQLGLGESMVFVEWRDASTVVDVQALTAACEIIVAPFLSERFSSVHMLEAMALGRPIVATNLGELSHILENGVTGYLVNPGDVTALADRMRQLLQEPATCADMGRRARLRAERFSVDAYAHTLQDWYTELVHQKHMTEPEKESA